MKRQADLAGALARRSSRCAWRMLSIVRNRGRERPIPALDSFEPHS